MTIAQLDASKIALVAGPLVLASYMVGSVPLARWHRQRRLKSDLRRADSEGLAVDPTRPLPQGREGETIVAVIEGLIPLGCATAAWHIVERIAPGGQGGFTEQSAIAFLSVHAVTVWQSIALWAGAAALAGHVAPIWTNFRGGGTGVPGALALSLAYAPTTFSAAAFVYLAGRWITKSPRIALYLGLFAAITWTWLGWVFEWGNAWGNNHGPEMALWVTAVGSVLVAGSERTRAYD